MSNITVYIKPGAKKQQVIVQNDIEKGRIYVVSVRALPKKGEANAELTEVLAEYFDCAKSEVEISSGHKSRYKSVKIRKSALG